MFSVRQEEKGEIFSIRIETSLEQLLFPQSNFSTHTQQNLQRFQPLHVGNCLFSSTDVPSKEDLNMTSLQNPKIILGVQ